MSSRSLKDALPLINSSLSIPQLGFGVWQSPQDVCEQSCINALKLGYRHIDTAQGYHNEAEVGRAIANSGLPRSDIFVTTKIAEPAGSVDASYEKCLESVRKLNPGGKDVYVDLFLVHTPNKGAEARKEKWLALERLHKEGKARTIGVSNYGIKHIEEMKEYATTWPPTVNQIELHPWHQQREIVDYCQKNGIVIEAYCPIVRNQKAEDETLVGVAKRCGKTPNQVLIRYCLQKGWVPLPKSDNPDRIRANADLYDFDISEEDMKKLDRLDQGAEGSICMTVVNH